MHGRLPKLEHLDVSRNGYTQSHFKHLFSFEQKWKNLLVLKVQQDPYLQKEDHLQSMFEFARSGCLSSLTELQVSVGQQDSQFDCRDFLFPSLNTLRIFASEDQRVKAAIAVTIYKAVKNKCLTRPIELFLISIKLKKQISDFWKENTTDKLIDVAPTGFNEYFLTQVSRFSTEEVGLLAAENPVTAFYQNPVALELATSFWNNMVNSFGFPLEHVRILQSTFSGIAEAFTRFSRGEIDSEQMAQDGFEAIQKTCDKQFPFSKGEMYKPMIKSVLKSSVENIPTQRVLTPSC